MKLVSALTMSLTFVAPAIAQQQEIEAIVGRWSHDSTGEVIRIERTFTGWELWHSRRGQFALVPDGTAGASIKMSGRGPTPGSSLNCYYYVNINERGKVMTWGLREGPAEECLAGRYSKVLMPNDPGDKPKAEIIRQAEEDRSRASQAAVRGPSELRDIDLVYFDRDQDNGTVIRVFDANSIHYSTRTSTATSPSNVITCTPDVPVAAIKRLSRIMINAGVPIRAIRPSVHPQFPLRMTIESYGGAIPSMPVLTLAQIDSISECNINEPKTASVSSPQTQEKPSYEVFFKNACAKPTINVHVLYYARDGTWKHAYENDIRPFERRQITDDNGNKITTSYKSLWYYAYGAAGGDYYWAGREGDGTSVRRYVASLNGTRIFKKVDEPSVQLTCDEKQVRTCPYGTYRDAYGNIYCR